MYSSYGALSMYSSYATLRDRFTFCYIDTIERKGFRFAKYFFIYDICEETIILNIYHALKYP